MKSSTVAWVKRHAKTKEERQIPHHAALDAGIGVRELKHLLNSSDGVVLFSNFRRAGFKSDIISFRTIFKTKFVRPNAKMPVEGHKQVAAL